MQVKPSKNCNPTVARVIENALKPAITSKLVTCVLVGDEAHAYTYDVQLNNPVVTTEFRFNGDSVIDCFDHTNSYIDGDWRYHDKAEFRLPSKEGSCLPLVTQSRGQRE